MAKFMYLFRSNPAAYRSMSPEQFQQTMKKWMDWKDTLEKNGHIKQLGERLDGTGKVVRGKAKSVTDGPYVEVKDTLCRALETWPVHGPPDNPSAWLMRVARNRAIDLVRRDEQFRYFAPELVYLLRLREDQPGETPAFEKEIQDDQLRLMFSC